MCALCLYPANPGWGVRCSCVCSGSGFSCAAPLLARLSGFVSVCVRASLEPCHSWLGCAVWVRVLRLGFWLRPATAGWGVGLCVCLCVCSACTPPLLARVCGVGACAWALVSGAPRLSGLGCWAVSLCGRAPLVASHSWLGCATLVCVLGLGPGCAPLLLAGVWGVRVRALLVPRLSWLGCVVWACVLGFWSWLCPATPGRGVGLCMCLCACSASTPLLLAGVCCEGVCAWARVSAAPRLCWLGCWGVRVCVLAPLLPRHSWLGCAAWVCVCLGMGFGCAPPPLAWVLWCVCVRVRAPLVPLHSWLGCAVWVGALGLRLLLRHATPGWGVGVCVCALRLYPATPGWGVLCGCVCLCSDFSCARPPLAWVLGCVCARVRA